MKQIDEYAIEYVNGNKEHESELFKMTYNLAKKVSWKQTFNEEDAEDIAQDTTIKAIEKLPTLESIETYEGWVVRIAQNKSKDFLKSAYYNKEKSTNYTVEDDEGNEVSWEDDTEDESITYRPEVQLDNQTRDKLVQDIINDLPEKQKIVAIMHFYDGMTLREIAEDLGIPMSSVMGQFQTAKKNIKASVTEIQKRDDLKLYNISAIPAIPFFMYLLGNFESEYPTTGVASTVAETTVAAVSDGATSNVTKGFASKTIGSATKATASSIVTSTGAKIGITVALIVGIARGGYAIVKNTNNSPETAKVVEKSEKDNKKENTPKPTKTSKATKTPNPTPTDTIEATPEPTEEVEVQQSTDSQPVVEQATVRTPGSVTQSEIESFIGYSDGYSYNETTTSSTGQQFVNKISYKIFSVANGYGTFSAAQQAMFDYNNANGVWQGSTSVIGLDSSGNLYLYDDDDDSKFVALCAAYTEAVNY